MKKPQILLCGSIAIDRLMTINSAFKDHLDKDKLDIISLSFLLNDLKDVRGGVAANIAYSLALLGQSPMLMGSVGQDSHEYIDDLAKMGINTSYVYFSQLPTASFNCISDQLGCQIGGFYPGAMSDSDSLTFKTINRNETFVVLSPHDPKAMLRQVEECQKEKLRLFFDIGQQVINTSEILIHRGVDCAELLIVNEHEISMLCKKIHLTEKGLKAKIPVVITTLGNKGSVIEGNKVKEPILIPIAKPKKVLDPTGAGDGYRAGFLYGYIRGWDLKTCGQMGALTASYVIEKCGAQNHVFTKASFIKRYKESFGEDINLNNS